MRNIVRKIYYILKSLKIYIFNKNIDIAWSSEIRYPNLLEGFCKIGKRTYFNGRLGKYSYIGDDCRINANIGRFCSISSNVKTIEGRHPIKFISTSPVFYSKEKQCGYSFVEKKYFEEIQYANVEEKKACIIGNDVWIGENVLIKSGVTVGNGAIIAMGAVVVHNVEPYSIVGGIPARIIKRRFSKEKIKELEELQWWNKSEDTIKKYIDLFNREITNESNLSVLQEK